MPRGRKGQDPFEAKSDSVQRIVSALAQNPEGLKFKDLKRITGLHQDTLTNRLPDLKKMRIIEQEGKLYKLSSSGFEDSDKRNLVELISSAPSMTMIGGSSLRGTSQHLDEAVILGSSSAFVFPGISPSVLSGIRNVVHKYWMLHQISILARTFAIDPLNLTGEKPLADLVEQVKGALGREQLVLAFTVDQEQLIKNLNKEYVEEVLRVGTVEDGEHIESRGTRFFDAFREYSQEKRILEFLQKKGQTGLEEVAEFLETSNEQAKQILNGLLIDNTKNTSIRVFNERGAHVRTISSPRHGKMKLGKTRVRLDVMKRKSHLRTWKEDGKIYYSLVA